MKNEKQVQKLTLQDGTLKFQSIEHYENFFEHPESVSIPEFENLETIFRNQEQISEPNLRISQTAIDAISEIEDTPMIKFLDPDFMLIIGEFLIKLDFEVKLAIVTKDFTNRAQMTKGDYSAKNINIYDFDDDVLDLLLKGLPSTVSINQYQARIGVISPQAPTITSGCRWNKCDYQNNKDDTGSNFTYRIKAKHVYQAVAIYFRLFSEAKHMKRAIGMNLLPYTQENSDMQITYDYLYHSKKKSVGTKSGVDVETKFDNKLKIIYYVESRGLNSFRLDTHYKVWVGGDHGSNLGWWDFNLKRISKN